MAFSLQLPAALKSARWKLNIRNLERNEDPRVTFIRSTAYYRWNLRTQSFMDPKPDPADVPSDLVDVAKANLVQLCEEWNKLYPENPV